MSNFEYRNPKTMVPGPVLKLVALLALAVFLSQQVNASELHFKQHEKISNPKLVERITDETIRVSEPRSVLSFFRPNKTHAEERKSEDPKGWIKRHTILFGTLVGFSAGFVVGISQGRTGDDLSAGGRGLFYGGTGAGVGALWGSIAGD